MRLKPKLCKQQGLVWDDVLPVLETMDSDKLKAMMDVDDPVGTLRRSLYYSRS